MRARQSALFEIILNRGAKLAVLGLIDKQLRIAFATMSLASLLRQLCPKSSDSGNRFGIGPVRNVSI
jgi:hypothetical protein